jgi:hypothetical protein
MKVHPFQGLLATNEEFGQVIHGLERRERAPTYNKERSRWAKAHVEGAQVEANRQFFDEFDAMIENNAIEAYKFLADRRKWVTDLDAVYLEIRHREQVPTAKGLPPRVVILPDWEYDDEKRYEEDEAEEKKHAAIRRQKKTKKRAPKRSKPPQRSTADSRPDSAPTREEGNHR